MCIVLCLIEFVRIAVRWLRRRRRRRRWYVAAYAFEKEHYNAHVCWARKCCKRRTVSQDRVASHLATCMWQKQPLPSPLSLDVDNVRFAFTFARSYDEKCAEASSEIRHSRCSESAASHPQHSVAQRIGHTYENGKYRIATVRMNCTHSPTCRC